MTPNFERLTVLARFMHELTPDQVNLDQWVNSCGSVACLLGWACMIPEFQADGLCISTRGAFPIYMETSGFIHEDSQAGRIFFGIDNFDEDDDSGPEARLFAPRWNCPWDHELPAGTNSRDMALHRLRRLFEKHGRTLELS